MADAVSDDRTWNRLGSDLAVVSLLAVATAAAQTSLLPVPEPVRILSGLLLVLLVPGYALIAAVFPRSGPILARSPEASTTFFGRAGAEADDEARGLVRLTLSLAASVAVTSLVGIALGTTAAFSTRSLAVGLAGVTLVCSITAFARRTRLPPEAQYVPAIASRLGGVGRSISGGSRFGGAVRVVVIASLLLSMGSAAYAVAVPQQGETPTELYLLTENETGDLTASGYPNSLQSGQPETVHVGVRNYEGRDQRFTVVVTLDRVVASGNSTTVIERAEIDRFSNTLVPNQWWRQPYTVDSQLTGSNLRLTHYLYRGDAPAEPTVEGAYRVTYLRVGDNRPTQAASGSVLSSSERQRIDTGGDSSVDAGGPPDNESTQPDSGQTGSPTDETPSDGESTPSNGDSTPSDDEGDDETTPPSDDDSTESGDETPPSNDEGDDETTPPDDDDTESGDDSTQPDDGSEQPDDGTSPSDGDGTGSDDSTQSDDDSTGSDDETTSSDGDGTGSDDEATSDDDSTGSVNESAP